MPHDLRDPAFLADPGPMLARMRAEGELVRIRVPLVGWTWFTTTDAGARALLKDTENFARSPEGRGGAAVHRRYWWLPGFLAPLTRNILLADGADHKRLRGLVDKAFARASIEDLRGEIAVLADELLDRIDPSRPVDIVAAYTRRLPLAVICALLGMPAADRERIARWIAPISGPTGAAMFLTALPGLWLTLRHFRKDFQIVRRTGRPGLIHELVMAEDAGERLGEDELLAMVFTLFVAGHETTVHLIDDAILGLIDSPQDRARVTGSSADAALAVEEFLRYFSPVMQSKPLFARRDLTFRGTPVRKGDQLAALLIAANHDGARFESPHELRPGRRPNAHLGFGHGPHVCLGMQLARAEAQIALNRLFLRFPNLALAGKRADVQWSRRIGLRGLPRLMLDLNG